MSGMNDLMLIADGKPHLGWKEIGISRAIDIGPHSFHVQLTDKWAKDGKVFRRDIKRGHSAQVLIGNEQICSGYVERITPNYDANRHSVTFRGRSKLGDAVDCSIERKEFASQSLYAIATTLLKPFGIEVLVEGSDDVHKAAKQLFRKEGIDTGQPIWEYLEELARIRALLLTSNANGDLVITRAGTRRADTSLVLGVNIKACSGEFSDQNIFSDYVVIAQQADDSGGLFIDDVVAVKGQATSKGRYRPIIISSDSPADIAECRSRAKWQRNVHFGRGEQLVYTVAGWRQQPEGRLWQPNELVSINDTFAGVNGDRLIIEVRFLLNEQGKTTELKVMPREAFDLIELPERVYDDTGSWLSE